MNGKTRELNRNNNILDKQISAENRESVLMRHKIGSAGKSFLKNLKNSS